MLYNTLFEYLKKRMILYFIEKNVKYLKYGSKLFQEISLQTNH